jgi:hypothetical protein
MDTNFDMMIRVQVLEGAVGVPCGTWAQSAQKAAEHTQEMAIHPMWFATEDTGMVATIRRTLGYYDISEGQFHDLLVDAFMGMGGFRSNGPLFFAYGQYAKDQILGGLAPSKGLSNRIARWMGRKLGNSLRKEAFRAGVQHTDPVEDFEFEAHEGPSTASLLAELYLSGDPDIRQAFDDALKPLKTQAKATQMWLGALASSEPFKRSEIAAACGLSLQTLNSQLNVGIAACHKALETNRELLSRLSQRLGRIVDVSGTTESFIHANYVGAQRYARL